MRDMGWKSLRRVEENVLQAFDSEEDGLFEVKFVDIQFREKDT